MSARPTKPSDEPEAVDQVMLSVLSNRGRDATVLTAEQERLLDDWVAGRLAAADAERAAALAGRNTLAAERLLERRLQQAAERGPAVPERLRARVLASHSPPKASAVGAWWRSPFGHRWGRRQWLAIAGAVALASVALVVGNHMAQRATLGDAPVQVAMVTIGDRSALFEPSDVRMRGAPQPAPTDQRFRDVDMPAGVLRDVVAQAGRPVQGDLRRQLEPYLPNAAAASGRPLKLIVDAGLRQRLDGGTGADRPVRIYDLADPRAADIARMLNAAPDGGLAYLLTTRP